MTSSPAWDDLVTAAVVGTERRPFRGLERPHGCDDLFTSTDLLGTATAVWAYQEAGRTFGLGSGGQRPAAPVDERPLLPAATLRSLGLIRSDRRFTPLLPEWLELAVRQGGRLPADLVPDLLESTPPPARVAAASVAGPVAGWLAEFRPEWAWAVAVAGTDHEPGSPEAAVEELARSWTRSDERRLAALAQARVADPAQAREFVERVFAGEPGAFRAQVVNAFSTGLSQHDEPFLIRCLNDRRKDVREAAQTLLARLPDSEYGRRVAAEVMPRVRVEGRLRARLALAAADQSFERQVAAVPLDCWVRHLGRPPEDLVRMATRDSITALLDGWTEAAATQGDQRWARALLDGGVLPTVGLLDALPIAEADQALIRVLHGPGKRGLEAVGLLHRRPRPWSAALTQEVLEAVRVWVGSADRAVFAQVREALPAIALGGEAGQAPLAAELAAPEGLEKSPLRAVWAQPLAALAATMSFRLAMHEEFRMSDER